MREGPGRHDDVVADRAAANGTRITGCTNVDLEKEA